MIRDEQVKIPDLGREFLTAEVREELTGWSEDESLEPGSVRATGSAWLKAVYEGSGVAPP